jgi:hypothetical protein
MIKLIYPLTQSLVIETDDKRSWRFMYVTPDKIQYYHSNEEDMVFATSVSWRYVLMLDKIQEYII